MKGRKTMNQYPEGIEIISNVMTQEGVETLEGTIGPLILGKGCQSHFIALHPGMYCDEHPHSTESIIFTVKGEWVLCSQGKRFHMKPGSLFWFGPNIPTGYEAPFHEDAFILIFKGERSDAGKSEMIQYLEGLREKLTQKNKEGVPFSFRELPEGHPAAVFAAQLQKER